AFAHGHHARADIDEGYGLTGVGGMRLPGTGIGHLFDVAMVSGDQRFAADLVQRGLDAAYALVQAFHGLDRGLEHPGVANHVAVGVVDDNDVVTLLLDGLDNAVGDLGGAHFWLQVIG